MSNESEFEVNILFLTILANLVDLDSDIVELINEHFWELLA